MKKKIIFFTKLSCYLGLMTLCFPLVGVGVLVYFVDKLHIHFVPTFLLFIIYCYFIDRCLLGIRLTNVSIRYVKNHPKHYSKDILICQRRTLVLLNIAFFILFLPLIIILILIFIFIITERNFEWIFLFLVLALAFSCFDVLMKYGNVWKIRNQYTKKYFLNVNNKKHGHRKK